MVIGGGLKAKYGLGKSVLDFERFCLDEQSFKSLTGVFKDQSLEECLSGGCAKESPVSFFGHINADNQMLFRAPNPLLELTKLLQPGMLKFVHVETSCVKVFECSCSFT